MLTAAELSAVKAASANAGGPWITVKAADPYLNGTNGGAPTRGVVGTGFQAGTFTAWSPTGAQQVYKGSVAGKDYFYVADARENAANSVHQGATVATGGHASADISDASWNQGSEFALGTTKGRLFDFDPIAAGTVWNPGTGATFIKDVLIAFSGPIIAAAGIVIGPYLAASSAGGASGGVGASEGVSIVAGQAATTGTGATLAGGTAAGGTVAGTSGFTLAGDIPAYTAAQNAAGAAAASSSTYGTAGFAASGAELAGGGAAAGGGVAAGGPGTSSATWLETAGKYAGTAGKVLSAASTVYGAVAKASGTAGAIGASQAPLTTSDANPLGLANAAGGYYGVPYSDDGTQTPAPFVSQKIAGVPVWIWAAVAIGATVYLNKRG